jgi:uncharacterized coiled-coil DUF342 family protein
MTNRKINHPLRTIEIAYNELKPFHPMEEAMLERYTRLHNFVSELSQEYVDVQTKFEVHDVNIKKVIARFKAIKVRMAHLGSNAKSTINMMVPGQEEIAKTLAEAAEFNWLLEDFNKEVEKLSGESNMLHRVFVPLDHKDEQLTEVFNEYKQFRGEINNNADNCSIDLGKYSADEEHFIGSIGDMTIRQTEFIGVCNMVIDRYNFLIEEVEKVYAQWEQYGEMIEMLKLMEVRPYNNLNICLN